MKTFFLKSIILSIFISYSAFGQVEKGTKLLGGSFGLSTYETGTGRAFNVSVNPNLGIFLNDKLAVGGAVNFGYGKSKNNSSINIGFAPFLRYYFELNKSADQAGLPTGQAGKIWLFLQGQPGYYWYHSKHTFQGDETKYSDNSLGIGLGVGLTYFITDNIGLEGILSYNTDEFYLSFSDLAFRVGFQIYLPKGKKE